MVWDDTMLGAYCLSESVLLGAVCRSGALPSWDGALLSPLPKAAGRWLAWMLRAWGSFRVPRVCTRLLPADFLLFLAGHLCLLGLQTTS